MELDLVPVGAKLVIIEDDAPLREALAIFLRVKGWLVETFGSGEESNGVVNWGEYTAVICDLHLPREDGLFVLRRVREASDKVLTVLITTYAGEEISERAASAGVDRILFKPFSTTELLGSLEIVTKNRSGRGSLARSSPK